MYGGFPFLEEVGDVKWQVTEQGSRAVIEVWRENNGAGLFKAYIKGPTGRCELGTLIPEGGCLHLRRTLSVDSLKRQGAWPIRQIEEEMIYSFREQSGHIEWEDEILRRCARQLPQHTVNQNGEIVSFIFRFDSHSPFPFVPIFCFARVENGRLIFSFYKDGTPHIFQKEGNDREEANKQRREQYGKSDYQGAQRAGGSAGV